jgi:hypothetical protein
MQICQLFIIRMTILPTVRWLSMLGSGGRP